MTKLSEMLAAISIGFMGLASIAEIFERGLEAGDEEAEDE